MKNSRGDHLQPEIGAIRVNVDRPEERVAPVATTVGGFGMLAFAILPPLQQFGVITALTIAYAFIGSVFVLPSLLVLWTRYLERFGRVERGRSVSLPTPLDEEDD